jgi:hypothetical protein
MHGVWLLCNHYLFITISSNLSAHISRDIALSDYPHHTSLRPFHVTARTAVLTTIFFFHVFVNVMLCSTPYEKKVLKVVSSSFQTCSTHKNTLIAHQSTVCETVNTVFWIIPFRVYSLQGYYSTFHPLITVCCICLYVADKESQSPAFYSVTINTLSTVLRFVCTFCLKKHIGSLVIGQVFKKWYQHEFMVSEKKMDLIIIVSQNFILVNWWIFCSSLSAAVYPLRWNQFPPLKEISGLPCASRRHKFTKLNLNDLCHRIFEPHLF